MDHVKLHDHVILHDPNIFFSHMTVIFFLPHNLLKFYCPIFHIHIYGYARVTYTYLRGEEQHPDQKWVLLS